LVRSLEFPPLAWRRAVAQLVRSPERVLVGPTGLARSPAAERILVRRLDDLPRSLARDELRAWREAVVLAARREAESSPAELARQLGVTQHQRAAILTLGTGAEAGLVQAALWRAGRWGEVGELVVAGLPDLALSSARSADGADGLAGGVLDPIDAVAAERWSRTIGALTREAWQRLRSARVALVGCGRSGSLAAQLLALQGACRDLVRLGDLPALEFVATGFLISLSGSLGGLDCERPLVVGILGIRPWDPWDIAPPNIARGMELAAWVPYTDAAALTATLGRILDCEVRRDGDSFAAEGKDLGPLHGRLHAETATLLLARTREVLDELDPASPSDLFPPSGAVDFVCRLEVEDALRRLPEWRPVIEGASRVPEDGEFPVGQPTSPLLALEGIAISAAASLRTVDIGLSMAPEGWSLEVAARMRPGSFGAAVCGRQAARPSRAAALIEPGSPVAGSVGIRLTKWARAVLGREGFRERAAALAAAPAPGIDEVERAKRGELAGALAGPLEETLDAEDVELGYAAGDWGLDLWMSSGRPPSLAARLLGIAEVARRLWPEEALFEASGVDDVDGVKVHRLRLNPGRLLAKLGPEAVEGLSLQTTALLAEAHGFTLLRLGRDDPAGLKPIFERARSVRDRPAPVPLPDGTLVSLGLSPHALLHAAMLVINLEWLDAAERQLLEKLAEVTDPLRVELLAREESAALRLVVPRKVVAETAKHLARAHWQDLLPLLRLPGRKG
jgi:hypothetical protein